MALNYSDASFLGRLRSSDRDVLFAHGREHLHRAGEYLCREGDPPTGVIVVLDGYARLTKAAASGRETMLELRGPGDVLGEMSVVDGRAHSATATAVRDLRGLAVSATDFQMLLDTRAAVAGSLLWVLVDRLRQASRRQLELGTVEVMGRVCRRIAELADLHGEPTAAGVLIRGSLSQQDLANWSGVSRDGVVRTLHELRDLRLIDSGRGRILILDLEGVRRRAGLPAVDPA
jgi:CRP/FNR family transcriptional regulator, cyclic AMP receptor protein